ncbi:hypothetical protein [Methanolobus vulcani]|nr:hypothetical protein [Methanolobus vulcani]
MENQPGMSCKKCKNMLKKQKLGVNVVYYCSNCGCMTSADLLYDYTI